MYMIVVSHLLYMCHVTDCDLDSSGFEKIGHFNCFVVLPLMMIFCRASVILCLFLNSWTHPEGAIKERTAGVN
jgi:hypothetical protein